jgi:hypothetical protein
LELALKEFVDLFQKVIAIGAVIVGGWWFLARGEDLPRASISHDIFSACLNAQVRWIRAIVTIENVGLVRVELYESNHRVSQVFPLDRRLAAALDVGKSIGSRPGRIDWPEVAAVDTTSSHEFLEPGETYTQYTDFLVASNIQMLQVASFYKNPAVTTETNEVGWFAMALHDVGEEECK